VIKNYSLNDGEPVKTQPAPTPSPSPTPTFTPVVAPKPKVSTTPAEPSIWGRLGQLSKDTAGAVVAGPRFAWDVMQSFGNDDEAYNGVRNTFTTAGADFLGRLVKPIGDVAELPVVKPALEKLDMVNREVIREPLTTFALMGAQGLYMYSGSDWAKAYSQAQNVSFGQALVGHLGALIPGEQGVDKEVDWNDPKSVENYFNHGSQKFWSGLGDFAIQIGGDVSIAGGKLAKAARGSQMVTGGLSGANRAEKIATTIQDISVAEDGLEVNKWSTALQDFADNDSTYAFNHPMLKNSTARGPASYALGQAKTMKDVGFVLRAVAGDPNALAEIRAVGRADLANPIGKSLGEIDAVDQWALKGELFPDGSPKFPWDDDAIHAEIGSEKAALEANNELFNRMWSLEQIAATPGGALTRGVGAAPFQAVERFVAKGRSAKFYDLDATTLSKTATFQPTPFHRMYQIVSWGAGERPAGMVDLNDAESSREISSVVKRAMKVANVGDEQAREMLDSYLGAATPELRAASAYRMERRIFASLAAKHGLDVKEADEIYNTYNRGRATALTSLHERGYAVDLDGTVFKVPFFESQTANILPMMDFDLANSVLRRHNLKASDAVTRKAVGSVLNGSNKVFTALDYTQSLFKVGALLRLGYTARNGIEAQARIASSLGAMTSMRHMPKGMAHLVYNTGTAARRFVDKRSPLSKTMSYGDYKTQLDSIGKEVADTQKLIADFDKKLELERLKNGGAPKLVGEVKEFVEPEFKSKNFTDEEIESIDRGRVPERFKDEDFEKESRAAEKFDSDKFIKDSFEYEAMAERESILRDYFGLSGPQMNMLRYHGVVPLKKVLNALEKQDPNYSAEFVSAIIEHGDLAAIEVGQKGDYIVPETFTYREAGEFEGMAYTIGRSKTKYVPVDWYPSRVKADDYASGGGGESGSQFVDYWNDTKSNELAQQYVDEMNQHYDNVAKLRERHERKFGNPANAPEKVYQDPIDLADRDLFETLLVEKQAMYDKTNEAMSRMEQGKRRMASGTYEYTGVDGTVYTLDEAYGGPLGDMHWNNASSENSYLSFADDQGRLLSGKMVNTGFGAVEPSAPHYWTEWASTLNRQFGNSLVSRKLAAGENPYNVVTWLRNSTEGRMLRQRIGIEVEGSMDYVMTAKGILDEYLPNAGLQLKLANRETLTPEMLRTTFTDPATLPTIHGHVIEENLNLLADKSAQGFIRGAFKLLGSMPEDAWARHPVYDQLYRQSLQQRIDDFTALNGRPVSTLPDDRLAASEMQLAMKAAHQDAVRGTKQLLFTIDRKTNLASVMKLISPFFSAFENSVKTWAKLAYEKPQLVNRANLLFTAPNRAGNAYDAEGNPVAPEDATMDDYIRIEVPEALKRLPIIGKGLSSLDQMSVQKRSLDVIFQGSTELPVGPYVTIPVSEIVKNQPSYEESLRWAIPFGPSRNAVQALLPSWVKRQLTREGGQNDPQYANTFALIWQTEQHKRREQGLKPLSDKEIKSLTDAYYSMRTVANLVLPFAPTFNSPYKYYIDQYRQFQEKYKQEAPTKFWEAYGDDFFDFTMSLSKNNTGIGASVNDVTNAKKYSGLVAEVSAVNPKLIGLITSTGRGSYEFSQAAYMWQQENTVSPGSDLTFRGRQSPQESIKDTKINLGWIKYRSAISKLDTMLSDAGFTSYQQSGAEAYKLVKNNYIAQLGQENNDWYDDYNSTDRNKYQNVVKTFDLALNNKKFMADHGNDSTWKSIKLFLDGRDQIAQLLSKQEVKNIDSPSNLAIRLVYDNYIAGLKKDDIGFADIYDRYFVNDPVYDKVYTKVGK